MLVRTGRAVKGAYVVGALRQVSAGWSVEAAVDKVGTAWQGGTKSQKK